MFRDPECSYDHCQRFLFSQTTFQFQKISGDFVVGQAIPNEHANTNIGFSEKFRSDKTSFVGGSICNSNYRTRTPRQDYLCELLREMRNNYQIALPDQWKYCVKKKTANIRDDCNDFTQKEALIEYLTERYSWAKADISNLIFRNPRFECEESYIDALLYDVKITSSLINIWSDVFRDENDNARTMINFGFCLTRSGLLRFLGKILTIYKNKDQLRQLSTRPAKVNFRLKRLRPLLKVRIPSLLQESNRLPI